MAQSFTLLAVSVPPPVIVSGAVKLIATYSVVKLLLPISFIVRLSECDTTAFIAPAIDTSLKVRTLAVGS